MTVPVFRVPATPTHLQRQWQSHLGRLLIISVSHVACDPAVMCHDNYVSQILQRTCKSGKEGLLQEACLLGRLDGALVWSPWGVRGGSASSSSLSLPRGSACLHKRNVVNAYASHQFIFLCVSLTQLSHCHIEKTGTRSALFGRASKSWLHSTSLSIWLWTFLTT